MKTLKNFFLKFLYFTTILLILTGIFFLAKTNIFLYFKNREEQRSLMEKTEELRDLEQKKQVLEKDLKNLESTSTMEKIIRQHLQAQKPGEELLVISEEEPIELQQEEKTAEPVKKSGFWKKIWEFLYP